MKKSPFSGIIKGLLVVAITGFVISGCKKAAPQEDTDTTASNENSFAQASFNEVGNISDQAAAGSMSSYRQNGADNGYILSSCATITFDTINHNNADSITVDFGTQNCLCKDLRYRRGKINITYTKPHYWDSLDVITITFSNYYVNNYGISGIKTITNMGRINGQSTFNVTVNAGTITKPTGGSFTWNSNITRKWTAGENTPFFWLDDEYTYTGSSNGFSSNGQSYTALITSPLVRQLVCPKWFVKGVLDFTPNAKPMRSLDFGTGACDDIVVVTISGHQYTVHMW
jgi:hypothetical protein